MFNENPCVKMQTMQKRLKKNITCFTKIDKTKVACLMRILVRKCKRKQKSEEQKRHVL